MTKPLVYITRKILFPEALDMISKVAEIKLWAGESAIPYETLLEQVKDIDGLLVYSDKVDATVLDAAPRLKVISNYAVGYDNIDVAKAAERGILVGNTPVSETTADFAFALLMAAANLIAGLKGEMLPNCLNPQAFNRALE